MTVVDRLRLERAVLAYEFWLDLAPGSARRRRALRYELRANLVDAVADRGVRAAVTALGPIRELARAVAPENGNGPRWRIGVIVGAAALAAVLLVQLVATMAWMSGAAAAGSTAPVTGSLALFPGSWLRYQGDGAGFVMSASPGWAALVVGAAAFALASRPWRAVRTRP